MNIISNKTNMLIEQCLKQLADELNVVSPLKDSFEYSLFPKGKRIRPVLALSMTSDMGAEVERFVNPALALELVHASSLVHDDLPALDNDDFRRGKPSCHRAFGEATAILTGDLLISEAFALVADRALLPQQIAILTRILAQAFRDVCHGQQRDVLSDDRRGSLELLHRLKTGALFRAAAQFGGVFAEVSDGLLVEIGNLGENIGLLFQVNDDLLDLMGESEGKGRPQGSDQRNNRQTYGSSFAISELRHQIVGLTEGIERGFLEIEKSSGRVCNLTRALFDMVVRASVVEIGR